MWGVSTAVVHEPLMDERFIGSGDWPSNIPSFLMMYEDLWCCLMFPKNSTDVRLGLVL